MEETTAMLEHLDRIGALRREGVPPAAMLGERAAVESEPESAEGVVATTAL